MCKLFIPNTRFKILGFPVFLIAIYDHLRSDSAFVSYRIDRGNSLTTEQHTSIAVEDDLFIFQSYFQILL